MDKSLETLLSRINPERIVPNRFGNKTHKTTNSVSFNYKFADGNINQVTIYAVNNSSSENVKVNTQVFPWNKTYDETAKRSPGLINHFGIQLNQTIKDTLETNNENEAYSIFLKTDNHFQSFKPERGPTAPRYRTPPTSELSTAEQYLLSPLETTQYGTTKGIINSVVRGNIYQHYLEASVESDGDIAISQPHIHKPEEIKGTYVDIVVEPGNYKAPGRISEAVQKEPTTWKEALKDVPWYMH